MMMVELNAVPLEDLPIDAFATHLRLAEGFGDLPGQTERLQGCLTAAIAALEARLGKYLLERQFIVRTDRWTAADHMTFSAAPVTEIIQVKVVHSGVDEIVLDPQSYSLRQDAHRPEMIARTGALPLLGVNGSAEIIVRAGYSAAWEGVPAAMRQAVMMLAEDFFERDPKASSCHELPCAVCLLVEPFRDIRLRGRHTS